MLQFKMAEDADYEVEEIVDRGLFYNEEGLLRVWYLIKFKGYPDTDNQWIPAKLTNCRTLIREFNKKRKFTKNVLTPPQSDSDGIEELFVDVVGGVADGREGLGVDGGENGVGMDGFEEDGGVGDKIDDLGKLRGISIFALVQMRSKTSINLCLCKTGSIKCSQQS
ncbi:chromobox protein homolog 5-like isoform X1 [Daphnia magna]|uniref:chromobox protein homolog 5-like isoform X1 n=2 Tax=Daphnia magna TaxID=35525 RepID=UPI001E1BA570|nr:chromobox protein homolog 5-like isoform X1 [Daphnia magna]